VFQGRDDTVRGLIEHPDALAQFIDKLPLAVAVLDSDRRLVLMNRALEALTGFDGSELIGVPCRHMVRTNLCSTACPALEAKDSADQIWAEADMINGDRRRVPVRVCSAALRDDRGRLAGFVETFEDKRGYEGAEDYLEPGFSFNGLLGQSDQMREVFRILPIVAQTDSSVLITGETGTGKDLVAEWLHQASARKRGPFVKINCGAVPETLLESELFGHRKGAFTGAVSDKPGRIRLAHGGTLFLTEVGDLPLALQVKLLTFLDDKVVYPLGSGKGFEADVRIVAATHRQLERMVAEGRFREDLLFRLNVVRVHLPPLRERGEDLRLLLDHFLGLFNRRFGKSLKGLSDEAWEVVRQWPFRGNVRELRNVIEYAANICQRDQIGLEHLPVYMTRSSQDEIPVVAAPPARATEPPSVSAGKTRASRSWAEVERDMILEALKESRGKKAEAAKILGWGRSTLWRKMKQFGLNAPEADHSEETTI
jgi:PAS domain S-box-containing protein